MGDECPECGESEYYEDEDPAEGYVSWTCAACGAQEYSADMSHDIWKPMPGSW